MKNYCVLFLSFIAHVALAQNVIKRLDNSTIKVVYSHGFGVKDKKTNAPIDANTVMYAASLTKPLFGYVFLKLVDKKVFELDKPIVQYLKKPIADYPKWKDLAKEQGVEKITPRMLLSHSSGLPILRFLYGGDSLFLIAKPSEKFYYSNEGMNLLGFVVEEYTGQKLELLVKELVFDPLNMPRSGMVWQKTFEDNYASGYNKKGEPMEPQKRTNARAAGSMVSTSMDYAEFLKVIMTKKGLSADMFHQALTPQIALKNLRGFGPARDTPTTKNDKIQLSWGLGWGLFKSDYGQAIFHGGNTDGWKNYCVAYPDKKMAVILLSNSDNVEPQFGKIINLAIKDTQSPLEWMGSYDNN
jgi:CubicO group peptidase (beta-lactamase class C family)